MSRLRIGDLAERARASAPTIRYYEQIGLLTHPDRQSGYQRRYGAVDVSRLTFIRRCREFGFSIDQVRGLASIAQKGPVACTDAHVIAVARLVEVRQKLAELRKLERSIAALVETCDATCGRTADRSCNILDEMAAPAADALPPAAS